MKNTVRNFALLLVLIAGPLSLEIVQAAELLVSDRATNSVLAFDPVSGALKRTVVAGGLDTPTDVTIGFDGNLYVAYLDDQGTDYVGVYNPVDGTPIGSGVFTTAVTEPGGLFFYNNELLVAEFANGAGQFIRRFGPAGNLVDSIDAGASGHSGMTIGPDGNFYATDLFTNAFFDGAVEKFDTSNNFASLGEFASRPALAFGSSALSGASGLVFAPDGNLFVAGTFSQNLIKFTIDNGAPTGSEVVPNVLLAYPSDVILAPDGNLLVTSLGNDNPSDPIYGSFLFPGAIYKINPTTLKVVGGSAFVTNGNAFQPTGLVLSPVPEPSTAVLAGVGLLGLASLCRRKR